MFAQRTPRARLIFVPLCFSRVIRTSRGTEWGSSARTKPRSSLIRSHFYECVCVQKVRVFIKFVLVSGWFARFAAEKPNLSFYDTILTGRPFFSHRFGGGEQTKSRTSDDTDDDWLWWPSSSKSVVGGVVFSFGWDCDQLTSFAFLMVWSYKAVADERMVNGGGFYDLFECDPGASFS